MNKNHSLGGMLAIGTTYLDTKDRVGTATARYSELLREGFGQGTAGYVATPSPMAAGATDDLNLTEYQTMKIMTGAMDQDLTSGAGGATAFYARKLKDWRAHGDRVSEADDGDNVRRIRG